MQNKLDESEHLAGFIAKNKRIELEKQIANAKYRETRMKGKTFGSRASRYFAWRNGGVRGEWSGADRSRQTYIMGQAIDRAGNSQRGDEEEIATLAAEFQAEDESLASSTHGTQAEGGRAEATLADFLPLRLQNTNPQGEEPIIMPVFPPAAKKAAPATKQLGRTLSKDGRSLFSTGTAPAPAPANPAPTAASTEEDPGITGNEPGWEVIWDPECDFGY
jgi:hypothetical protein